MPCFCQVERRLHSRESYRQPLPKDLGISPPSPNNLRSSRTITLLILTVVDYLNFKFMDDK